MPAWTESKHSIRNPIYRQGLVNFGNQVNSQETWGVSVPGASSGENQGTCQELVSHKAGMSSSQQGTLVEREALDEFVVLRVQLWARSLGQPLSSSPLLPCRVNQPRAAVGLCRHPVTVNVPWNSTRDQQLCWDPGLGTEMEINWSLVAVVWSAA